MPMSYEFDAPQFVDFTNLSNEQDGSDDFFENYVMDSCRTKVVKKKMLKLGHDEFHKPLVLTSVHRRNRRSFVGARKYKSTPHPKSLKRLASRRSLATRNNLPRCRQLQSQSKMGSKSPTEVAFNKVAKRGLDVAKVRNSKFVDAFLHEVKKVDVKCKKRDEIKAEEKARKMPLLQVNGLDDKCKKLDETTESKEKARKIPFIQSLSAPKCSQTIKSGKAITIPKPFSFATESRSTSRRIFDENIAKKLVAAEAKKKRNEELRASKEEEELVQLRKSLVHKPLPVKGIKPFEVKPQLKKPTVPISPKLGYSRKLQK